MVLQTVNTLPQEPWDLLTQDLHYSNAAMPARDIYHDAVKNALVKDGWTITQDPLSLRIGKAKRICLLI